MPYSNDFQTPSTVCDYMVSLLKYGDYHTILEPTPGQGNLVKAIRNKFPHAAISLPDDFWKLPSSSRYDCAVMNPPFTPMTQGYAYLEAIMNMTDRIVALLPWVLLLNSHKRMNEVYRNYGLISITYLPRSVFPGSRVQCCILYMSKGWKHDTVFRMFDPENKK